MQIPCDCFANLVADLSQDIHASVARFFMFRKRVAKVLNIFKFFAKICCKSVVRQSCNVRASVANLSSVTTKFSRIYNVKISLHSYECCATVLRKHANNSRLSGEKIKLSDIRENVSRLSYKLK